LKSSQSLPVTPQQFPVTDVVQLLPLVLNADALTEIVDCLVQFALQHRQTTAEQQEKRTLNRVASAIWPD
jgi:hypothetical protein